MRSGHGGIPTGPARLGRSVETRSV
jgi:hypothetical protein